MIEREEKDSSLEGFEQDAANIASDWLKVGNYLRELLGQDVVEKCDGFPSPETLAEYERILPGSVERLFAMVKMEQEHRHTMALKELELREKERELRELKERLPFRYTPEKYGRWLMRNVQRKTAVSYSDRTDYTGEKKDDRKK